MQAMAAAVSGTVGGPVGGAAAAATRGQKSTEGVNGEALDFGIGLIAKMQTLSIAAESETRSSSQKPAPPRGNSTKEREQLTERLAEKPSQKEREDTTTAPVEMVALANLSGPSSREPKNSLKQGLGGSGVDSVSTLGSPGQVTLADFGTSGWSGRLQGIPVGFSSHGLTNEASTNKATTYGEISGMLGRLVGQTVAGQTRGANPVVAASGISSLIVQGDGSPAPEENGVKAVHPQSSLLERSERQTTSPDAAILASEAIGPDGEVPTPSLREVVPGSAMSVVAAMRFGQSAATASIFALIPGKSAGRGSTPSGAVGGSSTPMTAGGIAAEGVAAPGVNLLVSDATPVGAGGDLGASRASGAAAVSPGDGFRLIDTAADAPQILRTTSNTVEVGVNDPAHGWVEVRAQNASGQIHASLSASSTEAQSALHVRLPEMAGYLADRDIGIRSLAVDHGARGSGSFAEMGGGLGGQGGEFSGGANPDANGGRGGETSLFANAVGPDRTDLPRPGGNSVEIEIARQAANGRETAIGYSPHTINVLA